VAAGEDEPQTVVGLARRGLAQGGQQPQLLGVLRLAAQAIQALAAGGRQQPGARSIRHALARPVLESFDQRLRDELLGQVEVAEEADQARGEPAGLLAEDALERGVRSRGAASAGRQA
jgi:hypothetical protein